ncbi:Dihydroorotase [Lacunisphaera limnophila]|uniref:Dihydroorotase n=1 Tax=Lacunisphaera limnophila TaxID=1838286 RepID=A0A1D8AZF6_9BACT|nr:dihydroorotase [Lacunisphaera limnophila]AOS46257.1 Dihydroorotase [Lacunisphaera limnophila]
MPSLIIKNGRVIDPASKRDAKGDVFIADGKFVKTLTPAQKKQAKVIDAKGLVVCPGLVDIHVHFREPGQTHKETILTGSQAAAAGGFTTVVCMPNTSPVVDNAGTVALIKSVAAAAPVHVYPTGCITVGMKGQALAPHGSLQKAGVVALTDDGLCVQSNELMHRAVEYAKMFGLSILDHCQDESMTEKAVMNEGVVSTRLGLKGWPHAAEDIIVARNIILSRYTGAHIHMQHISSAHSVELMRQAKKDGINVTAEATPHHIAFTEDALATYDTHFKMNPPLRTETDRLAIIGGLRDGTLDCIGTDHAPHAPEEKDKEFDYAPNGIIGLETALPVCLDILVKKSKFQLSHVIDLMTRKAADILKLPAGTLTPGACADVCIFDPGEAWLYNTYGAFSKSINSPWDKQTLTGRVKTTIVSGQVVYQNGKMLV